MSRRAAIVEEFDDDTDLPLPSKPLPNTGARGPLLEQVDSSGEDDDGDDVFPEFEPTPGPASPSFRPSAQPSSDGRPQNTVTDITPYKKWTCIYPIYIDAKRPYGTGQRRVARAKSVWYPLSKDIADATNRMGLGTLHEVNKAHPRDWENPGRVRVQWKKDGRLVNPAITTKKQLLETISFQIQRIKPDNIPRPPYQTASPKPAASTPAQTQSKSSSAKSKQPLSSKKMPTKQRQQSSHRLPLPPDPLPPLASRVSPYSPVLPAGVLIETVKAGMNAQEGAGAGAGPGAAGAAGGAGKGKRKVVRVRG